MEALRIKLYQNFCNYRIDRSFGYIQTYPLPTPSMIRGMVHDVLELTEYRPLQISIQGESKTVITNIQKVYKFDRDPKSRPNNPYIITVNNRKKTATHGISYIDLHVHMELLLHIMFEENENTLIKQLLEKINEKTIVLGRNEDIALVEEVKIVNLKRFSGRASATQTRLPMYVPLNFIEYPTGTIYRLPFWYEKINSFEDNRIFHFIDAFYVGKGTLLKKDFVLEDDDKNFVCFLKSPK